ncbi:MAG: GNAT family N-acetyltransferase [Chloroflexi bacterium]|nr:GNAT family N-acetyltransferase [Chloroflexota bacterium]
MTVFFSEGALAIRSATPADREAVLVFCQTGWNGGDYIEHVWDEWLNDPDGRLIVATESERPVALVHMGRLSPRESWFQGLRVDPAVRQRGLATLLTEQLVRIAQSDGAKEIRLATSATNAPVHRMMAKLGFRRLTSFAPYLYEATPESADPQSSSATPPLAAPQAAAELPARQADIDLSDSPAGALPARLAGMALPARRSDRLRHSAILRATRGLYSRGWSWERLTATKLREHERRGEVVVLPSGWGILRESPDDRRLHTYFLDGDDYPALARDLRAEARRRGYSWVRWMLPDLPALRAAFQSSGFTHDPAVEMVLYELVTLPSSRRVLRARR